MVKGNIKKLFFCLLAFSFFINILTAIYPEKSAELTPRKILLFFEIDKKNKWQKNELAFLYDSLLIKLVQECRCVAFFELPASTSVPAANAAKSKLTVQAGCDAWIVVSLASARQTIFNNIPSSFQAAEIKQPYPESSDSFFPVRILVRAYDLVYNQEVIRLETLQTDTKKIEKFYWNEIADALNHSYKKINQVPEALVASYPQTGLCKVSLTAAPGTIITGLPGKTITIDKTGKVCLELPGSRTYTLRACCPGYFPQTDNIYPATEVFDHTFKQQRTTRWSVSLYLQNLCYPGCEATFFPGSEIWYVRASLSTFVIGLPEWVVYEQTARPVIDFTFLTGCYLLKPDNFIRFYFSCGFFFRIIERSQKYLIETNNQALLFGFVPVGGMELSPCIRVRYFTEYTPLFYLKPSLAIERPVIELLTFKTGIRVLF